MKEIILASASPRRAQLLEQIGVPFRVIKSEAPEIVTQSEPGEIVKELSRQKAAAVAGKLDNGIVLGADTIVWLDGKLLGKPHDREDAGRMLLELQGRVHHVYTGVTLLCADVPVISGAAAGAPAISGAGDGASAVSNAGDGVPAASNAGDGAYADKYTRLLIGERCWLCRSFFRETAVHVHAMTPEEIEAYLDTGDPFDKAGSYGIQGPFAAYVDGIEGDYLNVVGLPASAVYQELKNLSAHASHDQNDGDSAVKTE